MQAGQAPKKRQRRAGPSFSDLPPQMRGSLQSLAWDTGILEQGTPITGPTPAESVVSSAELRGVRVLASYLRLASMRLAPPGAGLT